MGGGGGSAWIWGGTGFLGLLEEGLKGDTSGGWIGTCNNKHNEWMQKDK